MASDLPSFSIIINTLNRADFLSDAIRGVMQLDYAAFELIVVNGPSTDHTAQVLAPWAGRIKVLRCDITNLAVSRNVGLAGAAGEIVAFLDDDAIAHPQWLSRMAPHYVSDRVGAVGGFTVDNSGMAWQVRKTVCDRFGNPYNVDDFFDEKPLNSPGTPFYPSLLGTNASFRRKALCDIGGFDENFAYMLEETDVCLRLVDNGWNVLYEPDALVFHQFAPSHSRTNSRVPRTIYNSAVSKAYFCLFHGWREGLSRQAQALDRFRQVETEMIGNLERRRSITREHRQSLERDLREGIRDGMARANTALANRRSRGDLMTAANADALLGISTSSLLRVALVSQNYPPANDHGIAQWTSIVARGLAELGVAVHVITRAAEFPSRRFENGVWVHAIRAESRSAEDIEQRYELPEDIARWMVAVKGEVEFLKTFGVDLVSFPIWDLEALPTLDDDEITSVMSLHTTYLLARAFKPEWNLRLVESRRRIDRMIAAEGDALARAPVLLANSHAIVREIEAEYGVDIADRCTVVPHGTNDLLAAHGISPEDKFERARISGVLRVLVPGRFELRKGYDLALRVAAKLKDRDDIQFDFVGHDIDDTTPDLVFRDSGVSFSDFERTSVRFCGNVSRQELDQLYCEADLVMMMSRFESFGLVAIEAMAAGAAVVALSRGAIAEIVVDGRSGWLFDEDDLLIPALCQHLDELSGDRQRLEYAALNAYRDFRDKFSEQTMCRDIAAFYQQARLRVRNAT
jgi:glycosyltransferase involved in cell wall biosynthesis/GT2 family glycosyltransferase